MQVMGLPIPQQSAQRRVCRHGWARRISFSTAAQLRGRTAERVSRYERLLFGRNQVKLIVPLV
jgi:hypothetical protein